MDVLENVFRKERHNFWRNERGFVREGFVFLDSHWTGPGLLDSHRTGLDKTKLGQIMKINTFWVWNLLIISHNSTMILHGLLIGEFKKHLEQFKISIFTQISTFDPA